MPKGKPSFSSAERPEGEAHCLRLAPQEAQCRGRNDWFLPHTIRSWVIGGKLSWEGFEQFAEKLG
jgi:hypothetical protein